MIDHGLRVEVQSEAGAPFVATRTFQVHRDGNEVRVEIAFVPSQPVSAYRILLECPILSDNGTCLHSAAFLRMVGRGSLRPSEILSEGKRSPLTASYHFDERLGAQSFGLFPPLVILDGDRPRLLISPVSEDRDRFSVSWQKKGSTLEIALQFDLWGLAKRVPSFDRLESETIYFECFPPGSTFGPETFAGLHTALSKLQKPAKQELFWGSWNDGHFRDIDQSRILATTDWLRDHLPNVQWIQIDDGWAGPSESIKGSLESQAETLEMSDFGVFYKPDQLKDDPRFPNGLAGLASEIRQRGLRPMIWLTPSVLETSPLYQDHPEWFLDRSRLHFFRELRFLDFSNTEVRDYVRAAFDLVFNQWGFEGCKLDYWSMGFDQHDVDIREGGETSMELMHWFLSTLREYVGSDGLMLYSIDLPFGTPLRSKYFNQFRYYADSEGSCQSIDAMREQAMWAAFLVGLYGVQRYWVPDGDGLGMFDHFEMPENHFRLWGAFLLGSGTLTELAGWLHEKEGQPRLETLVRLARQASLGDAVTLPGYDFLQVDWNAPYMWVRHGNPQLIALTNWDSAPRDVEVSLQGMYRDMLSDEIVQFPATVTIGPEDGRVLVRHPNLQ